MSPNEPVATLLSNARAMAARVRGAVRGQSLWLPGVPFLHVLCQAAIIRQAECLESAIVLADADRGYAALPFVRPACEEFIWIKYLLQLNRSDAEAVIAYSAQWQVFESLRAQKQFVGSKEMDALGLTGMFERRKSALAVQRQAIAELGTRLGWDNLTISRGRLPTARFIAKKAGQLRLYDFIYGASSRHVHFSVAELARRAWGRGGIYEIGSHSFTTCFTSFALGWCSHMLLRTVLATEPTLPGTVSRFRSTLTAEDELPPALVPIVTADELTKDMSGPPGAG